jgi:hypothetical protein
MRRIDRIRASAAKTNTERAGFDPSDLSHSCRRAKLRFATFRIYLGAFGIV